jgi:lambda repressor-like predicted transcriptional regulator
VKRYRRLRRLVPDDELVRRRAAGESLRALAAEYGVAYTTLGRYFARPEVARQLRQAGRGVRVERRAAAERRARERRLQRQVRRRAKEQAARERERALRAAAAARSAARRPRRSAYEAWLDKRDARLPPTRTELRSGSDQLAERTVASGGGIEAVIEATGLRSRENVLRLIDPAILVRAFDNDAAAAAAAEPERDRLRRLVPDHQLLCRRAAGEPLRRLAIEYGVAHTTLGRWFARPAVARQLRELARRLPAAGADEAGNSGTARGAHEQLRKAAEQHATTMRASYCPVHGQAATDVRVVEDAGEYRIEASFCCERAKNRALQALHSETTPTDLERSPARCAPAVIPPLAPAPPGQPRG